MHKAVKISGWIGANSGDLQAVSNSTANITVRQSRSRRAVEKRMRAQDVKPTPFASELCCDRCGAKAKHDEHDGFTTSCRLSSTRVGARPSVMAHTLSSTCVTPA